jgi:hypothetical protein
MARSVPWVWPAIFIAVTACSGTTSTSNVTADQACTDLASGACNRFQACAPLLIQSIYGDASTCTARLKLTCPSALGANGSGATPSNVEACSQAYAAVSCTDLLSGTAPPACIVRGSLMQGAACAGNDQCSGANSYCNVASGQTCGVCGTQAAAGGVCTRNAECQPGLVCGFAATGGTAGACVTPGAQGAACDSPHPCASLLHCVNGTCTPSAAAGAACNVAASDCDGTQGLYCDLATGLCKTVKTASAGGTCGNIVADGTYVVCTGGSSCKMPTPVSLTGTCQAAAADGAMCNTTTTMGPNCLPPAVCTNGACKIPDPASCH